MVPILELNSVVWYFRYVLTLKFDPGSSLQYTCCHPNVLYVLFLFTCLNPVQAFSPEVDVWTRPIDLIPLKGLIWLFGSDKDIWSSSSYLLPVLLLFLAHVHWLGLHSDVWSLSKFHYSLVILLSVCTGSLRSGCDWLDQHITWISRFLGRNEWG